MILISGLFLEELPLESNELAANPWSFFKAARERHPWLASSNLGYVITQRQAMKELVLQDEHVRFPAYQTVEIMKAKGTGWGDCTPEMMLS